MSWTYEKLDENLNLVDCPMKDTDGSVTGHIVFGVKAWFDEHPEERKRLGWIKHIRHDRSEIDYDPQTQILISSTRAIDEYTVEDVYHVINKSEEMMRLEEMLEALSYADSGVYLGGLVFVGDVPHA